MTEANASRDALPEAVRQALFDRAKSFESAAARNVYLDSKPALQREFCSRCFNLSANK
jgi:hypothetical protein